MNRILRYKIRKRLIILCLLVVGLTLPFCEVDASAKSKIIDYIEGFYTPNDLEEDIMALQEAYPDIVEVEIIGETFLGTPIYAIGVGKGETSILLNGAHHAREWMTSVVLMEMAETYAEAYVQGSDIQGYSATETLNKVKIWIIPMLNVDGVRLQQGGLSTFPEDVQKELLTYNQGSQDFSLWKANVPEAIDPNRQYPINFLASFETVPYPSPSNYAGLEPAQINEVKAIIAFTEKIEPKISVAYHSAGEIIYWGYEGMPNEAWSQILIEGLEDMTGYIPQPLSDKPYSSFTDWFIATYEQPAFTIEIGTSIGQAIPSSQYPKIWEENQAVGLYLANEAYNKWNEEEKERQQRYYENIAYLIEQEEVKVFNENKAPNILAYLYIKKNEMFPEEKTLVVYKVGEKIAIPFMKDESGYLYVKADEVLSLLNGEVKWGEEEGIVLYQSKEKRFSLQGENAYDQSVFIINNREIYLLLDFLVDIYSEKLTYLEEGQLLIIQ